MSKIDHLAVKDSNICLRFTFRISQKQICHFALKHLNPSAALTLSSRLAGVSCEWTLIYRMLISTSALLTAGLQEPIDATWPPWRWVCCTRWSQAGSIRPIKLHADAFGRFSLRESEWKSSKSVKINAEWLDVCLITQLEQQPLTRTMSLTL